MTNKNTIGGECEKRYLSDDAFAFSLVGPRGVKFYLNAVDAFALMKRVADKIKPFDLLWQAEVLWKMPGMFAMFTSLLLIYNRKPWMLFLIVPSSILAKLIFIHLKFFVSNFSTPFRWVGNLYSVLTGYGLFFIGLVCLAYFKMGWLGVCLYIVANAVRIGVEGRMEDRMFICLVKNEAPFLRNDCKCFLIAFERIARKYKRDISWFLDPQQDNRAEAISLLIEYINEQPKAASRLVRAKGFELPFKERGLYDR